MSQTIISVLLVCGFLISSLIYSLRYIKTVRSCCCTVEQDVIRASNSQPDLEQQMQNIISIAQKSKEIIKTTPRSEDKKISVQPRAFF